MKITSPIDRFDKVLRVLRFPICDAKPLSSIVPSTPGLRPAPRGYAFYDNPTLSILPLVLPPLPSAPPPMGRYGATAYLKLTALYKLCAAPPLPEKPKNLQNPFQPVRKKTIPRRISPSYFYSFSFSANCFSSLRTFFISSGRWLRAASTLPHWA